MSAPALRGEPFLRDPAILAVTMGRNRWEGFDVRIKLASAPARILLRETTKHVGEHLVVILGDAVVAAPVVQSPVAGEAYFSVPFKDEQLRLAAQLKAGMRSCSAEASLVPGSFNRADACATLGTYLPADLRIRSCQTDN